MTRLGVDACLFHPSNLSVHAIEMLLESFIDRLIAGGRGHGKIAIPHGMNRGLGGGFLESRPRDLIGSASAAATVEYKLLPGPRGVVGDELVILPECIELLLGLSVEDEIAQRGIVAEVAHYVVEAGTEKAAFVDRIDGIKTAALAKVKTGGEHGAETREGRLVARTLSCGNRQRGVFLAFLNILGDALFYGDHFLATERGTFGDHQFGRWRFARHS